MVTEQKKAQPGLEEIEITARGYGIYVKDGEQGPEYWSDEIGGGVLVWHTGLVAPESLKAALRHYEMAQALEEAAIILDEEAKRWEDAKLHLRPIEEVPDAHDRFFNYIENAKRMAEAIRARKVRPRP